MENQDNTSNLSPKALATVAALKDAKGQFLTAEWQSEGKPKAESKKAGITLTKITKAVVRTGVNFANLATVKEGIANGERGEVQSLPWGEWAVFPFIITHKGAEYLRLTFGANTRPTVRWFVNGVEVSRDEYNSHLPPSALAEREPSEVVSIKLAGLLSIG